MQPGDLRADRRTQPRGSLFQKTPGQNDSHPTYDPIYSLLLSVLFFFLPDMKATDETFTFGNAEPVLGSSLRTSMCIGVSHVCMSVQHVHAESRSHQILCNWGYRQLELPH